jgi:hypothetical protein
MSYEASCALMSVFVSLSPAFPSDPIRPRSPVGRPISPVEAEAREKILLARKFPHNLSLFGEGQEEVTSPPDATHFAEVPFLLRGVGRGRSTRGMVAG